MKEKLVSFETSKLAKEKGFQTPTIHYYIIEDTLEESFKESDSNEGFCLSPSDFYENWNQNGLRVTKLGDRCFGCETKPNYYPSYSAPTQSLLQKWLREVYDIDVYVIPNRSRDKPKTARLYHPIVWFKDNHRSEFKSKYRYEEALELGLQEALKKINEEKSSKNKM